MTTNSKLPSPSPSQPWIQTFSGVAFDLLDPKPEQVRIEDIAHALARLCRYTGHCERYYSVAEHSILVASILPPHLMFEGLMHDAIESYIGDLSSPLKVAMPEYRRIEAPIRRAVAERFGLEPDVPPLVKKSDMYMLEFERRRLLSKPPRDWNLPANDFEPQGIDVTLMCWKPRDAEREFLHHFEVLSKKEFAL